jgi:ADP-ribose pyrophosphatase YjhB (NUDIX family)
MKIKTVVGALIRRNNKILTVERARGFYRGMLGLPGGHVEENETEQEALLREVKEETGLIVSIKGKIPILKSKLLNNDFRRQVNAYETVIVGGELKRQKSEVNSINWSTADELLKSLEDNKYSETEIKKYKRWFKKEGMLNEN